MAYSRADSAAIAQYSDRLARVRSNTESFFANSSNRMESVSVLSAPNMMTLSYPVFSSSISLKIPPKELVRNTLSPRKAETRRKEELRWPLKPEYKMRSIKSDNQRNTRLKSLGIFALNVTCSPVTGWVKDSSLAWRHSRPMGLVRAPYCLSPATGQPFSFMCTRI